MVKWSIQPAPFQKQTLFFTSFTSQEHCWPSTSRPADWVSTDFVHHSKWLSLWWELTLSAFLSFTQSWVRSHSEVLLLLFKVNVKDTVWHSKDDCHILHVKPHFNLCDNGCATPWHHHTVFILFLDWNVHIFCPEILTLKVHEFGPLELELNLPVSISCILAILYSITRQPLYQNTLIFSWVFFQVFITAGGRCRIALGGFDQKMVHFLPQLSLIWVRSSWSVKLHQYALQLGGQEGLKVGCGLKGLSILQHVTGNANFCGRLGTSFWCDRSLKGLSMIFQWFPGSFQWSPHGFQWCLTMQSSLTEYFQLVLQQYHRLSASCRNLGVMFDKNACVDDQITSLCWSAHFHLRNIRAIRNLLTDSAAAQLVHALATARIDYCNSLLYGIPDYKLTKLQRVHNTACRIVCNIPKFDHITQHMYDLHWLPIKMLVRFKDAPTKYRAYNGMAPAYLCDLVKPYVPGGSGLRSEYKCQLERTVTRLKCMETGHFSCCYSWMEQPTSKY